MSYHIAVYNPAEWDLYFDSTFYPVKPKKCQYLYKWAKDTDADIVHNLCFFNFMSSKELPGYTVQYLRIPRLGGDCGYGSNSSPEHIILPNGDEVSGWGRAAIKNGIILNATGMSIRPHNAIGQTKDGRFFVVQNRYNTEKQVCNHAISFLKKYYNAEIKLMLWEDGGGSVGTYCAKSKLMYAPMKEGAYGRAVCSVFCAKAKAKINRTLARGDRGDDIKILQMMLACEADGIFGAQTRKCLIEAQMNLGVMADGIAGPITLKALGLR